MAETNRTTVYLEPELYRALKVKSATTDRPLSELVNEAVRLALREDEIDLAVAHRRLRQSSRPFEQVLKDLKRRKLL